MPEPPSAPAVLHCDNQSDGYSLDYPADWFTDTYDGGSPCHLFHPEPFEAVEVEGGTAVAVIVEAIGTAYRDWVDSYEQDDIWIVTREDTTVGGAAAVTFLYSFAEAPDLMYYDYVVDKHGEAFILRVDGAVSPNFEVGRESLDLMARSLLFKI